MNKTLLQVDSICKSFFLEDETKIDILKNISFDVNEAEVFGIMGESGAGKSTLLNVISTIDVLDSGRVLFDEKDISQFGSREVDRFRNEALGFVYQSHHLLAEFDVLENILMPTLIKKYSFSKEKDAIKLLDRVGLKNRLHHSVKKLSGGEQQRVAIARSLINSPKLIFCDEPTGNLDYHNSDQVFSLFRDLSREYNIAFIIVSHSSLLKNYADRIIYLKDGLIEKMST